VPGIVNSLSNVTAIAVGTAHTVPLKGDGTVWSWGSNTCGQLGIGEISDYRFTPVQMRASWKTSPYP
jgi:alpha-tubulin suppressor-like RCC1 family protein